jgi:ABC-type uncharacterized transport system permease subunit
MDMQYYVSNFIYILIGTIIGIISMYVWMRVRDRNRVKRYNKFKVKCDALKKVLIYPSKTRRGK